MNLRNILITLEAKQPLCDVCLSHCSKVHPSNQVNQICNRNTDLIRRSADSVCVHCNDGRGRKLKNHLLGGVLAPDDSFTLIDKLWIEPSTVKTAQKNTHILQDAEGIDRAAYFNTTFNKAISCALQIDERDYLGGLSLDGLITLKTVMSNIHAEITRRLTVALAEWLIDKLKIAPDASTILRNSILNASSFSKGFDLDLNEPNLIGEIKGNIPSDDKSIFKSAQITGLNNDVLQMFGREPKGKNVSPKSKIHRKNRECALKFLGVYDSSVVRKAACHWMDAFNRSHDSIKVKPGNDVDEFSKDVVYLIFLKLDNIQIQPGELEV
jgi:hypothetical protein